MADLTQAKTFLAGI